MELRGVRNLLIATSEALVIVGILILITGIRTGFQKSLLSYFLIPIVSPFLVLWLDNLVQKIGMKSRNVTVEFTVAAIGGMTVFDMSAINKGMMFAICIAPSFFIFTWLVIGRFNKALPEQANREG